MGWDKLVPLLSTPTCSLMLHEHPLQSMVNSIGSYWLYSLATSSISKLIAAKQYNSCIPRKKKYNSCIPRKKNTIVACNYVLLPSSHNVSRFALKKGLHYGTKGQEHVLQLAVNQQLTSLLFPLSLSLSSNSSKI